jgi:hypothetical protein
MDLTGNGAPTRRLKIIAAVYFLATFFSVLVIPFGVLYGGLAKGWMTFANALFGLVLLTLAFAAMRLAVTFIRDRRLPK